jgi:hypothetical protein
MFETGMSDPSQGLKMPDAGGPQGMLGGGERGIGIRMKDVKQAGLI